MCDWMVFYPDQDAGVLHIEVKFQRLLELQPETYEETDAFCESFYPVIDKIQEICLEKGLRQEGFTDVTGIDARMIKPRIMMRIVWNIYNYTRNNILLTKCEFQNANPLFTTLYSTIKGFLPGFMRNIINIH